MGNKSRETMKDRIVEHLGAFNSKLGADNTLLSFLIELLFTYHEIHTFNVQKSMVFSIFTKLCNHHHDPIPEHTISFLNISEWYFMG